MRRRQWTLERPSSKHVSCSRSQYQVVLSLIYIYRKLDLPPLPETVQSPVAVATEPICTPSAQPLSPLDDNVVNFDANTSNEERINLARGKRPKSLFKPLPPNINAAGRAKLMQSGALQVPNRQLCGCLLAAYIDYMYPFLPALNLRAFMDGLSGAPETRGTTSLLLFQSIMYAGAAFVDLSYLTAAGYLSRKEAMAALFLKARVR